MKTGLLDYDTKVREQWVGCHPGQVRGRTSIVEERLLSCTLPFILIGRSTMECYVQRVRLRGICIARNWRKIWPLGIYQHGDTRALGTVFQAYERMLENREGYLYHLRRTSRERIRTTMDV